MRRIGRHLDDGFTLIELLLVLIVLAILAAIVLIATGGVTEASAKSACQTAGKTVHVAEVAYNWKYKSYGTIDDLVNTKYLMEKPISPDYTITVAQSTGVVSGTLTQTGSACYSQS